MRESDYDPVAPLDLAPFFAGVINADLCTYVDCRDHLTVDEVADLNEVLVARNENERLAYESAERKAKSKK